jgi:uncharacterized membrane protein HdeD (DUF308 family)
VLNQDPLLLRLLPDSLSQQALLNGIVTLILGVLIVTMQAWGLLWVIGVLVGISFLFSGIDLLAFSASFHGDD